jgi:NAD(P)-dependent dehydrogenase (short-subunit alcohol dehydrogenase family)
MKIDLSGKTAVVTGSTAGIGRAIARGLASTGAKVIVNGHRQATVDNAVQAVKQAVAGASVFGVVADISTRTGCDVLVGTVPAIDILVNNVGIFEAKNFSDITDEDWIRFLETNVMSGVRLSRSYLPGMLEKNWGRIVFISSESALHIPKEMIHYGVTKTSQLAVSRGLAELTAGTGVTVNAILPGPTRSDGVEGFLQAMADQSGQSLEKIAANFIKEHRPTSLLQRFETVDEVANMVIYACSKEASATNGAALRVEGGIVRTIA